MIRQLEEREKRALRRALGVKPMRHQAVVNGGDEMVRPKDRDYFSPWKADYTPPKPRRGRCVLTGAKRAMSDLRDAKRAAFFAGLK
jgi:hypothetical protein